MKLRPVIMLSEDQCREVETLAALLNQDQIADYFGICRTTFHAICKRDDEVAARYKKGKAKAIAHVANGLLQKARTGDTTSSIFYLKTQAGWRETHPNAMPDAGSGDPLRDLLDHVAQSGARIGLPSEGPPGGVSISDRSKPGPAGAAKLLHGHEALRRTVARNANEHAADLAALVVELQQDGETTLRALAAALNARGILTRRGGTWQVSTVRNLLQRIDRLSEAARHE